MAGAGLETLLISISLIRELVNGNAIVLLLSLTTACSGGQNSSFSKTTSTAPLRSILGMI